MSHRSITPDSIQHSLLGLVSAGQISVMPDYFIDRFVRIQTVDELMAAVKTKAVEGGGGSIRGVSQSEVKGGNAVNLAYSLGKFGASVNLTTIADSLPARILLATFEQLPNVKVDVVSGRAGFTVALEFVEGQKHVNVMVSDVGDLASFDGSSISDASWKRIEASKFVCVVNWAANSKGSELCELVFSRAKERGAKTFFDPADLSGMAENIQKMKRNVFGKGLVDKVSMNENEARVLSGALASYVLPQDYSRTELQQAAALISDATHSTVDLHTRLMSLTCTGKECVVVPCHRVEQKIVTGAGDIWDAADIVGHILGWSPEQRLGFANASAGLYVSRENAEPPSTDEVLNFLERHDSHY